MHGINVFICRWIVAPAWILLSAYLLQICTFDMCKKSGAYTIYKHIFSIAYLMNLKKFFIFCDIFIPTPSSLQMLWASYDSWNGFLKIWLTYSSNTSQSYLRYKIEVNFLAFFSPNIPYFLCSVYVARKLMGRLRFYRAWRIEGIWCFQYVSSNFISSKELQNSVLRVTERTAKTDQTGRMPKLICDHVILLFLSCNGSI